MIYIHKALRGVDGVLSFARTKEDRVKLSGLYDALKIDTLGTLEVHTVEKMKATRNTIYEITLKSMRIFYVQEGSDICLVHLSYKQKNKTEKKDIKTADNRAGQL